MTGLAAVCERGSETPQAGRADPARSRPSTPTASRRLRGLRFARTLLPRTFSINADLPHADRCPTLRVSTTNVTATHRRVPETHRDPVLQKRQDLHDCKTAAISALASMPSFVKI